MSFRPHRLLLSRLRTRLPSCFAGQRLRPGILQHQQRLTIARYYGGDDSASPNGALGGILDDIRDSAGLAPDVNSPSTPHGFPDGPVGDTANSVMNQDGLPVLGGQHFLDPIGRDEPLARGEMRRVDLTDRQKLLRSRSLHKGAKSIHDWRLAYSMILHVKYSPDAHKIEQSVPPSWLNLWPSDMRFLEILETGSQEAFYDAWSAIGRRARRNHWRRLSLWLLYHTPTLLPKFLRGSSQGIWRPSFIAVSDCIRFLSDRFPDLVDDSLITESLHPDTWPSYPLAQAPVRKYLNCADRDGVHRAWSLVCEEGHLISPRTILCFMKRFTEFGDVDHALEALQEVYAADHISLTMNSEGVLRHCCKLLMLDSIVENNGERNFLILPKLLALGVKPNLELLNIAITNAYKSGDSLVAQDLVKYMREQGIDPSSHTYLASLTGSLRVGDSENFASVLSEIKDRQALQHNPWILSKLLHSHFISNARHRDFIEDPHVAFYTMLDLYNKLHDITPLKELSIVPPRYTPPTEGINAPPSVFALYIMIATYLRFWKSLANVERVYQRFQYYALRGHKTIAPLAATDHTINEFLVAFRGEPQALRPAVRLVEDMQRMHVDVGPTTANVEGGIKFAAPSVRTWTLLMSCFVFQKQPHAADRVKAMMKKHGVEFELEVWNMIINNYSNSQNIPALAQSIKEMQDAGYNPDQYTINSLRYLRDPERLWVAVDELYAASNSPLAADSPILEEGAEEEEAEIEINGDWLLDRGLQRMKSNQKPKT
ncbi:hypothetical protein BDV06DRAFT_152549 [Aspergillus oleicola]